MTNRHKAWLAAGCTILVWATAFPFSKYLMEYLPAEVIAEGRIFLGGLVLMSLAFFKGLHLPKSSMDWILFVLSALGGNIGYQVIFNIGIQTIPSATSSIILALTPLTTSILVRIIYKEYLKPAGWIYTVTAFIGVAIVLLWNGAFQVAPGAVWTLGAMFIFAWYNVINRGFAAKGYQPFDVAAWSMGLGGIIGLPFLPKTLVALGQAPVSVTVTLVYLGLGSSALGYALWSYALDKAEKASDVMNFMYLSPIIAALVGFIMLGEVPNGGFLLGGATILVSLYLFNKYR